MNQLDDADGPFETPTYNVAADSLPAVTFEKIFKMICIYPQQAVLLYHQAIQGTLELFITVLRVIINMIRLL